MKRLTIIISSVCLGVAELTNYQAEASEAPVVSNRVANISWQQTEKEPKEEIKNREDSTGEPGASQSGGIVTITDHVDSQVEIPREVNRVVATNTLPLPSIITAFLGSGEKIVDMAPVSMNVAKTGLLGELFPDILNISTDFMSDSDTNMEESTKLEPDVVLYSAGGKEIGGALRSAGFVAVVVSVNKWNYDSIETYDQWISLLSQIFSEKGDTVEQASRYSQNICEDTQNKVSSLKDEEKKGVLSPFNYNDTTMVTSSKKSFGQFWCDAAGGHNMAEGMAAKNSNAVTSMEQVYEWNPDIIFIANLTPAQPKDLCENVAGQGDWNPVRAVQDKNVYKPPLDAHRSYTPSTNTPMTLLWMAKQVYPDLFSDMDMTQEIRGYYKELYDVDLSEEQAQRMYYPGREAAAGYKRQALMHKVGMI